jgi:hypothetical protein
MWRSRRKIEGETVAPAEPTGYCEQNRNDNARGPCVVKAVDKPVKRSGAIGDSG